MKLSATGSNMICHDVRYSYFITNPNIRVVRLGEGTIFILKGTFYFVAETITLHCYAVELERCNED